MARRGRPPGTTTVAPNDIIRLRVHFTVHHQRQPRLAQWLTQRSEEGERGLAADLAALIERALAGRDVALAASGGEGQSQVYEIDMSGLMEWE